MYIVLEREMTLSENHYSKPSIVLIESNRELRGSIVDIFEFEGYSTASASSVREGIALLAALETPPRLVICEISRESMSATQILEAITAYTDDTTTFLFLTTHNVIDLPSDMRHPVYYLRLPFQVSDLLDIVQHALSE